jgi:tetratricopeptide (TPR) repeat protein
VGGNTNDAHVSTLVGDSPPVEGFSTLLSRGAAVGRYVILDRIGSGGMSVVYAAYDPQLDRRVAIKLLRSGAGNRERQQRLLREAQAMARLSHPNVLTVHDVGTFGDRVFIATEFVDGPTLRQWQDGRQGQWRAILAIYLEAGRGLASAHAAGLVHRDFKPQNVLIDTQGRARVLDFGLARALGEITPDGPPDGEAPTERPNGNVLETPLTRVGALMGTPAYMSPEQLNGALVDARTDQFSFCVALYEALYGDRPFGGDTLAEVKQSVNAGKVREPPPHSHVPKRVRTVLLRGLSLDAAERFPSLEALLVALAPEVSPRRRRLGAVAVAVAVLAVVAVGGVSMSNRRARNICGGADGKLAAAWGPARRQAVASAFSDSGSPVAAEALERVDAALDRYAHKWAAAYTDSCEATHVRGEQSAELLDLRTQCLSTRLSELRATTELLARADAHLVTEAPGAIAALSRIEDCADVNALKAPERLPGDAASRAKITPIRDDIAVARAADRAGQFTAAVTDATRALAAARTLHAGPLEAEALNVLASAKYHAGDSSSGIATMLEAALAATTVRDDRLAAQSWATLVFYGYETGRLDRADEWSRLAFAEAARAGNPPGVMGRLYIDVANLLDEEGKRDEAILLNRRAINVCEADNDMVNAAMATNNLAVTLLTIGHDDEALPLYRRACDIWTRELGPAHPNTLMAQENVAEALARAHRYDEAELSLRRDLIIRERTLGPNHPDAHFAYGVLARIELLRGRTAEAIKLAEREAQLIEKGFGDKSPLLVDAYRTLGEASLALNQAERAQQFFERAKEVDHHYDDLASADIAYGIGVATARTHGNAGHAQAALAEARRLLGTRTDPAAVELRAKIDAFGTHGKVE